MPARASAPVKVPFGHWGTQTFMAALRHDGLTAPWVIDCPMNRRIFEAYVETQLARRSSPATSSVSTISPATEATAILKERGAMAPVPAAYSPDLNPIEMAFANSRPTCEKPKPGLSMPCGR